MQEKHKTRVSAMVLQKEIHQCIVTFDCYCFNGLKLGIKVQKLTLPAKTDRQKYKYLDTSEFKDSSWNVYLSHNKTAHPII